MNIQQEIVNKLQQSHSDYQAVPSPDFVHRKEIEQAVKDNDGYCPCALDKNDDTLCMCKEFRQQEYTGYCHCGRYYKILKTETVCLCGSTKFKDKFFEVARDFTLKGYIVTMPMVFMHMGDEASYEDKLKLDELHKAKISQADIVYIVNVDGYIGESTREEIDWARQLGKKIEYLFPIMK